ncbi:MAG: hypothetical protein MI861_25725, partial [Pirellulales bacterium]|nr:hypothetical protein [Pirellulales bacterium]
KVLNWAKNTSQLEGQRVIQGSNVYVEKLAYPHIHIAKDFVTYSKNANNHTNLIQGQQVWTSRIQTAYQDCHNEAMRTVCRYMLGQFATVAES